MSCNHHFKHIGQWLVICTVGNLGITTKTQNWVYNRNEILIKFAVLSQWYTNKQVRYWNQPIPSAKITLPLWLCRGRWLCGGEWEPALPTIFVMKACFSGGRWCQWGSNRSFHVMAAMAFNDDDTELKKKPKNKLCRATSDHAVIEIRFMPSYIDYCTDCDDFFPGVNSMRSTLWEGVLVSF